jgi:ornithine--oxo-acid transaminase
VLYNVFIDEVQTGIRTGRLLATGNCCTNGCENKPEVKADILILKAISGGVYPVSAVLANNEL